MNSLAAYGQKDQPPVDAAAALADLAELERIHEQRVEKQRTEARAALQQAASNASAATRLYESAVEATGGPDFADWEKRNADLLREKIFQQAVQIHLRYLVMSLERGRAEDPARWAEPSMQYARDLAGWITDQDNRPLPGPARDLLEKPLAEGPFVRWLRLGPFLPSPEVWEQIPGNLGGILERNVRVPWRAAGDPRLDAAWQLELETAATRAAENGGRSAEDFNTRTAPALLFRRAMDRAAAGQPNRAAADLLDIARKNPAHPDFPRWAEALREMLAGKAPAG